MPKGIPKNGVNKGWIKLGQRISPKTEIKKGQHLSSITEFVKKQIPHNFKGWRMKHNVYREIYSPNHPFATSAGYMVHHRLIMEEKLGRYLDPKEVVHHINHNKGDNNPENLYLFEEGRSHANYERNVIRTYNNICKNWILQNLSILTKNRNLPTNP